MTQPDTSSTTLPIGLIMAFIVLTVLIWLGVEYATFTDAQIACFFIGVIIASRPFRWIKH